MKKDVKKAWVVVLKHEVPSGAIAFSEDPDESDVQSYWQLVQDDKVTYSCYFFEGKWVDAPSDIIVEQLELRNPLVVELVNIQEGFQLFFGEAGEPRFSDDLLDEIKSRVQQEKDRVKAARSLIEVIYDEEQAEFLLSHSDFVANHLETVPGFASLSKQDQSVAKVGAYLHHLLENSNPSLPSRVLQADLLEWGFNVFEINIAESFGRYFPIADHWMDLAGHLDWVAKNNSGPFIKLACLADTKAHARLEVEVDDEAMAAYKNLLSLNKNQMEWLTEQIS